MKNVRIFGRRAAAIVALAVCGCSDSGTPAASGAAGFAGVGTDGPGSIGGGSGGSSPMGGSPAVGLGGTPSGTGSATATGATTGAGGTVMSSAGGTAPSGGGSGGSSGGGGAAPGGAAGMSGGAGMGGAGGAMTGGKPPCLKDPTQLVMIGDSYVNWVTHTFPADMNAASMLDIADFAVGGTSMGSGGIGLIPPQFDSALMTHPKITAVIMDGGGNDILVPDLNMFPNGADCKAMGTMSPSIPDCQKIVQKALDAGEALFLHMAKSGVRDAVFFFYPKVPTGTWLAQDPNGMLDYALPKIQAACDGAYQKSVAADPANPIRCHFINMVPVFDGHMEYFAMGDLHPNSMGSKAMAAAVWAKMKQDCVAQPASSGCCAAN